MMEKIKFSLICIVALYIPSHIFSQNVGIGAVMPDYKLHVLTNGSSLLKLENSTALANNVSTDLFFKTGSYYTGAIKTIGGSFTTSRLGLFTFAAPGSGSLLERLSILDNGNVGIGTNNPGFLLDVNGRIRIKYNANTAGIWLGNSSGTSDVGFMGLYSDSYVGLYGNGGAGWNLVMNVITGKIGIGTTIPVNLLDVIGTAPIAGSFENVTTSGPSTGMWARALSSTSATGIEGEGYAIGIHGLALVSGSGSRFGTVGVGGGGVNNNFGIWGNATGGIAAYGVYGTSSGGSVNWAGYFAGDVYTTGSYLPSDRKLKNDIHPLPDALTIISQLKPSAYTYKTDEFKLMHLPEDMQYGLIADEVQQVLPCAVKKSIQPASYENNDEVNGRKLSDAIEFNAVNYTTMIPILIGAIQEQQKQIDELKKLVLELAARK
jgi:Chaperone of endosialidase